MNKFRLIIAVTIAVSMRLYGETITFKEYNFSIDTPDSWMKNPSSKNVILFIQSPDDEKLFVITAYKINASSEVALKSIVKGWKKSASSQGIDIDKEEVVEIGGIPFTSFSAKMADGFSSVTYMGVHGGFAYSIIAKSEKTDAVSDEEIMGIVRSFKLNYLSRVSEATNKINAVTRRYEETAGMIGCVLIAIWFVVFVVKKGRKSS